MLARALIRDRVELEMNLIDTARKPEREEGAVVPPLESRLETLRKTEVEKARGTRVEPISREAKVICDLCDGGHKRVRQWIGTNKI